MTTELVWKDEALYAFEVDGKTFNHKFVVNGIDGKRYLQNNQGGVTPTTHQSTGEEYQEYVAELVASRVISDDSSRLQLGLIYRLPDTGETIYVNYSQSKEYDEDYYLAFPSVIF